LTHTWVPSQNSRSIPFAFVVSNKKVHKKPAVVKEGNNINNLHSGMWMTPSYSAGE